MPGCEVEGDAMRGLGQERGTGGLGGEHAGLALDAELVLEPAVASHEADDGLGEVDVEIIADDVPLRVGVLAAQQCAEKSCEILLGPGLANLGRSQNFRSAVLVFCGFLQLLRFWSRSFPIVPPLSLL